MTPDKGIFRFADFELSVRAHRLTRHGQRINLPPLSFKLLQALAEAAPESVSREKLIESLWPDRVVGDETLTERVKLLRHAIEDDPTDPKLLVTERGWGYRLAVAPAAAVQRSPTRNIRVLTAAILALAAVLIAGAYWLRDDLPEVRSLVILPFDILSDDPDDAYLAGSIAEELRTRLGRQDPGRLVVLGRTTSEHLARDPGAIQQLDVDYLLEGSIRQRDQQKVVSLSLLTGKDQRPWWRDDFVVNVLSRGWRRSLVNETAIALTVDLAADEESNVPAAAWDAYLRGRHAWRDWTRRGFSEALSHFERALQSAPEFDRAHAGISDALGTLLYNGVIDREKNLPRARFHAARALELAPDSPLALTANAMLLLFFDHQPQQASELLARAVSLAPGNPEVLLARANAYWSMGCRFEAVNASRQALRFDPYSPIVRTALAWSLLLANDAAGALEHASAVLDWKPDYPYAAYVAAMAAGQMGDTRRAIGLLQGHDSPDMTSARGYWQTRDGQREPARELLNQNWPPDSNIAHARLLFALGDPSAARDALDRALARREPEIVFVNRDPSLRDIPRSASLQAVLNRFQAACSGQ